MSFLLGVAAGLGIAILVGFFHPKMWIKMLQEIADKENK